MSDNHPGSHQWLREISASDFSPAQQVALLSLLRRNVLAGLVLAKLRSSTVRAGSADYRALAEFGLAVRGADGWHQLTALGVIVAGMVTRELAKALGVSLYTPPRRRSAFCAGQFSEAGNA